MSFKESLDYFKTEWHVIKGSLFSFVSCLLILAILIFLAIGWFEERHYAGMLAENAATLSRKEATIAEKDATIQRLQTERGPEQGKFTKVSDLNIFLPEFKMTVLGLNIFLTGNDNKYIGLSYPSELKIRGDQALQPIGI